MLRLMVAASPIPGPGFQYLLSGIDTLEVCFYLRARLDSEFRFGELVECRETLRNSRAREPVEVQIGPEAFLLQPYGSSVGFPLVLSNDWAVVAYGPRNLPPFHVKFLSQALWRQGWEVLVARFLRWAEAVGFEATASEKVTRVDFCFDYQIPAPDFMGDHFVTLSAKEATYRERRVNQTFDFGRGDVKLRCYDKTAEIEQQSGKTFFYDLWKARENVWRIEWQIRKPLLKRFGLRSFDGLRSQAGDLLVYMSQEHDTLRIPTADSNRSRWPLHPLWCDVQGRAAAFSRQGVVAEIDPGAELEERLRRCAISLYGYAKAVAAMEAVRQGCRRVAFEAALEKVGELIRGRHDPIAWEYDVPRKASRLRLGGT